MNTGILWAIFCFIVVAVTKYLTSLRLRTLKERIEKDQQDAAELRRVLSQASEKEGQLKSEYEGIEKKLTALRNIIVNLERSHQRSKPLQSQEG